MRLSKWFASIASALSLGLALVLTGAGVSYAATPAYVALGDSYSSGNGAGSYISSSGDCYRSTKAYPSLWAAANNPSSFTFAACSGAVTTDVINNQLGALNSSTGLVSISIGGNDAGFADVMTTCVLESTTNCLNRIDTARSYVNNTLPARLDAVYSAIRAKAPSAKVVVLGYPRFYEINSSLCIGLNKTKRQAINAASDLLAEVTAKRVANHGFTFGDVRTTFTGHELCSGSAWLHSVTLPVYEAYHPNASGHSGGYLPLLQANA
ncbi:SGNH/GDSL hydrolase family protein [Streptomyces sp. GC420]|uniref:SGNH/GDSL hydrolase family protein n=1 Tax=Streptomyces sp. GC420 TaxID=2697568 RepID=UPI0014151A7E|nr:SGNH/GDSL hydrolase family protein [Streptomyces sp. GC420]NBM20983.1 lipase [Streptomyces sp. GC420]